MCTSTPRPQSLSCPGISIKCHFVCLRNRWWRIKLVKQIKLGASCQNQSELYAWQDVFLLTSTILCNRSQSFKKKEKWGKKRKMGLFWLKLNEEHAKPTHLAWAVGRIVDCHRILAAIARNRDWRRECSARELPGARNRKEERGAYAARRITKVGFLNLHKSQLYII